MDQRRDSGGPAWGVILLAAGLVLLLGNLGYLDWLRWDRWWPFILIVIGLWMVVRRSGPGSLETSLPVPPVPPGATTEHGPTAPAAENPTRAREFPTGGVILIGLGLAFLLNDVIGGRALPALILMAVGTALLLRERFS